MNRKPRLWGAIPAAGVGQRMGADLPKQYLPLGGTTVLDLSIRRLLEHPRIDSVLVALGKEDPYWQQGEHAGNPAVHSIVGGSERVHSVRNLLTRLLDIGDANDWVLVHDAARPCLRAKDLRQLIEGCEKHPVGGLLAVPVHDTMKRSDAAGQVWETVAREALWHAQTPQMFRLGQLSRAIDHGLDQGLNLTDEASAIEAIGERPLLVTGHWDNLKITRPGDLELAAFILQRQHRVGA